MFVAGYVVSLPASDGANSEVSNPFTVNPNLAVSSEAKGTISPSSSVTVNYGAAKVST